MGVGWANFLLVSPMVIVVAAAIFGNHEVMLREGSMGTALLYVSVILMFFARLLQKRLLLPIAGGVFIAGLLLTYLPMAGLIVLCTGAALSLVVVSVNGGWMPVRGRFVLSGMHRPWHGARLKFLADRFAVPGVGILSIGDVLLSLGSAIWAVEALVVAL